MATKAAMDDLTADAIRRALAAATAGRLEEARSVGEQALAKGGDVASLNAMLGMLNSRIGNIDRSVQHLRAAHAVRPRDPVIANNLVNALVQSDRRDEAIDALTDEVVAADERGQLLKLRAFLAQMTDRFDVAVRSYEQVLAKEPDDWESWNNLGNARRGVGDLQGSLDALRRAAEINPASAPVRLNYACTLVSAEYFDEAEQQLNVMASDFPTDAKPLRELHLLYKLEGRDDDALNAIEEAVRREPEELELWVALGRHRL
jgi:tetratricopeptide (TPR) repeat protein